MPEDILLGVVSDTHGTPIGPLVEQRLRGVSGILHAGDITTPQVLDELELIAPVTAVRGNCDHGQLASLPLVARFHAGGIGIRIAHELRDAMREPLQPHERVVVFGHTHVPHARDENGVLYLNPGSPSHARRGSGHNLALLRIRDGVPSAEIVRL